MALLVLESKYSVNLISICSMWLLIWSIISFCRSRILSLLSNFFSNSRCCLFRSPISLLCWSCDDWFDSVCVTCFLTSTCSCWFWFYTWSKFLLSLWTSFSSTSCSWRFCVLSFSNCLIAFACSTFFFLKLLFCLMYFCKSWSAAFSLWSWALAVWWQSHALFLYLYVKYGEWLWSALRWFTRLL